MPWKSGTIMDSRLEFVRLAEQGGVSVAELCHWFGISRETGFQYLRRYRESGLDGLKDRSRRPHTSPRPRPRRWRRRSWNCARCTLGGCASWPAACVISASPTCPPPPRSARCYAVTASSIRPRPPNTSRSSGWPRTSCGKWTSRAIDQGRCHPLTVLDAHSRYSLGLIACADQTDATVRAHLTALFRRYGLPDAILADNGAPWGGSGAQGYTAFEVWLLRLGIPLHHGRPYHPQTQGKDERFHRSLDVEVLQLHRFADLPLCQTAFDTWRQVYNTERPHEALG